MKETEEEKDKKFAAHIPNVLEYHRLMLSDGPRNRKLAEAIKKSVTRETSFLDIGAGTGVWAILAAKLGAKRVVAVEIEECLIPTIYKHAQENGVAKRIEIIHGDCKDVEIDGKFDCIVSELFGDDAFGAATVKAFVDIRERFLAPAGTLIPEKFALLAAPVQLAAPPVPARLEIKADFLASLRRNYTTVRRQRDRDDLIFLAEPIPLVDLDFASVTEAPSLANLRASWNLEDVSQANAIATTNLSTFQEGIELNSLDSQSWSPALYEFAPFDAQKGVLAAALSLESNNLSWTISVPSHPDIRPQTNSPIFAFTRLRMAQQTTPHTSFP